MGAPFVCFDVTAADGQKVREIYADLAGGPGSAHDQPPSPAEGETTKPMTGEELFWDLVEPMYTDPAVQRSTMMGLPCVRLLGNVYCNSYRTGNRSIFVALRCPTQFDDLLSEFSEQIDSVTPSNFADSNELLEGCVNPDASYAETILRDARPMLQYN